MAVPNELPTRAQLRISQIKITYLGPQEKPIPSLVASSQVISLTDVALTNLVAKGLPADIPNLVSSMIGKEYLSRADFRSDLEKRLGAGKYPEHVASLMNVSSQNLGKELVLENFSAIQQNKGIYDGDRSPYTKAFAATPEELRNAVKGILAKVGNNKPSRAEAVFSFGYVFKPTTSGNNPEFKVHGMEYWITFDEGKVLFSEFASALDPENTAGKKCLNEISAMFY